MLPVYAVCDKKMRSLPANLQLHSFLIFSVDEFRVGDNVIYNKKAAAKFEMAFIQNNKVINTCQKSSQSVAVYTSSMSIVFIKPSSKV